MELLTNKFPNQATTDTLGKTYGQLKVLDYAGYKWVYSVKNYIRYYVNCQCDCGVIKIVDSTLLRQGKVKSCGCLRKIPNIIGQKFGKWTVIGAERKLGYHYSLCNCDCGNQRLVFTNNLLRKISQSCGCSSQESRIGRTNLFTTKHGKYQSKAYKTYHGMISRCCLPTSANYKYYGAKGIVVSSEWRNSFENFYRDMGDPPSSHHSLDRVNYKLGYSKENCRWATPIEQGRNKSTNHLIVYDGAEKCMSEWSEITGLKESTISARLQRGWTVEKTLTRPAHRAAI